jgi:hypothetical protein
MTDRRFATLVAAALVVLAAASRAVPHPWNFTPMVAVALFGGARLPRWWIAALAVLGCLALGDIVIGVFPYEGMAWVYGSMAAVVAIGHAVRDRGMLGALLGALAGGALFFAITNFAVWTGALYPHSAHGLLDCYTAALPFYRNQIAGDLLFTGALFGAHALAVSARRAALA